MLLVPPAHQAQPFFIVAGGSTPSVFFFLAHTKLVRKT
jgi:hypothetical protein